MALKYLMDENVTPIYATQLRRKRNEYQYRIIHPTFRTPTVTWGAGGLRFASRVQGDQKA
ncbi:hypothetical protein [Microcoleus sp. T3_D1]|uniref:hypothetical protein n=1 Tax=Microcoleus sp. T3_D1 TaxID=3055427 RepID=UPI002FD78465